MTRATDTRYPLATAILVAGVVWFFASLAGGYTDTSSLTTRIVLGMFAVAEALVCVNYLLEWYRRRLERRVAENATRIANDVLRRTAGPLAAKDAKWYADGEGVLHLDMPGIKATISMGPMKSDALNVDVEPVAGDDGHGDGVGH